MNELIYELVIKSEQDMIYAISLVTNPAIEKNFIALAKEELKFATVDSEKRILIGAALLPNKKIYRFDEKKKEGYYVFFSEETVAMLAHNYIKNGMQNEWNLQHSNESVTGVSVIESWIVENPLKDKAFSYGLSVKKGDWMIMTKIDNDEIWNDYIKTGELKGFSIEVQTEKVLSNVKLSIQDKEIEDLTVEEAQLLWDEFFKNIN